MSKKPVGLHTDFGSGRQINMLEMLFERMPMGIAVLDKQYHYLRYNTTWDDFAARYAPPSAATLAPGVGYFEHQPGTEEAVRPLFERVLAGEQVHQAEVRLESEGGVSYWDVVLAPLSDKREINGILAVAVDATERVEARQNLEHRVDERTHEIQILLQVSRDINSTLELETLLEMVLDQLKTVVDYTGASILTLEKSDLIVRAYRGPIPKINAQQLRFSLDDATVNRDVIQQQAPLIIADTHDNSRLAEMFRQTAGNQLESTFGYVRSWLGVPLMVKGVTLGMLTLDHNQPNYFSKQHAELVLAFANHTAVAIENARLYREIERRAEESEALFAVQQAMTSKLEMDEIMQMIADEARRLTNADISAVYLLDGDELEISYISGDAPQNILGYRLSVTDSIAGRVVKNREAILVSDTWTDSRVDRTQVRARSLLIVPLISDEKTMGTITVANRTPGTFDPDVESLLTKLATSVVIGLENARLYHAESDRREVAESLRETLAVLNSKLPLDEILDHIANQAVQLLGAHSAIVYRILPESQELVIQSCYGVPDALCALRSIPLYEDSPIREMFDHETYVIRDIQAHLGNLDLGSISEQSKFHEWLQILNENYGAYLGIPLIIEGKIYGSLGLYYLERENFSEDQIELGIALANQAVLAIENANLVERAEESAIASERNRLARDLHDAVTQTLFSATMIADVLPKIWNRNPEEGQRRLEELRQLTSGALSEMRTLLVELRPSALDDTDLGDLIGHQINAFTTRTRIRVTFKRNCVQNPPPEIKEMFYRIVQEAFNNIAKHAEAETVSVQLDCQGDRAKIVIQDDGIGFDPEAAQKEGLGLGIMHERARSAGASLEITSHLNGGTCMQILWQSLNDQELYYD